MFRERLITIELNQKTFKGLTIQYGKNLPDKEDDFAEIPMISQ